MKLTKNKVNLTKAQILVVDQDSLMADVLRDTLTGMGFTQIIRIKSGREAIDLIRTRPIDILITEWDTPPLDGLSLIRTLRKAELSRFAMLPTIMLTSHTEQQDVVQARDVGTTEFLAKPFTAKTLHDRLKHVIDFPRDFIICEQYVGPDRRRTRAQFPPSSDYERRVLLPIALPEPDSTMPMVKKKPYKLIPNKALKKKLGLTEGLDQAVTPEILNHAQTIINSFKDESVGWISSDLHELETQLNGLAEQKITCVEQAQNALLSITSRAGTFNFMLASHIAFSFYSFLRNKFTLGNNTHHLIIRKHLEVLKIILARQITGLGNTTEQQLAEELSLLTYKLQNT
jgi:CheY-like chemotaxis protein